MIKQRIIAILILLIAIQSNAQNLAQPEQILEDMTMANNYFLQKWPDPGAAIVTDKVRPSNLWTRATYFEGLMQLYFINKDTSLYQYAYDWAQSHNWEPTYGNLNTRDGDHQCCGQTYIELYELDPQPFKIQAITTNIDNMINSPKIDDWSWIDAIQMSMPVFAKLGVVYNDTKYFDRMYEMFNFTKMQHGTNGLYNQEDGLWYRDKNFDPPYTTPNGLDCYWSRGNGWVYAALVRVLDILPETNPHRDEYMQIFKEMSAALIKIQREDGFWNTSMVDPNDFGGKESSGTAFFVFGLSWGINQNILDKETYLQATIDGWNGLTNEALHDNGFLGWMQSTGKQPSDGQPLSYTKEPNFEDYGLGAFLLAGAETYKLSSNLVSSNDIYTNENRTVTITKQRNGQQAINVTLDNKANIDIELIDLNGKVLSKISNTQKLNKGNYSFDLPNSNSLKGIFLIKTNINNYSIIKKIVL